MGAPSGLHPLRKSVPSGFLARKDVADDPNAERTRKRGALGGVKAGGESEREGGGQAWSSAASALCRSSAGRSRRYCSFPPSSPALSPSPSLLHSQLVREDAGRDRRAVVAAPADEHDAVYCLNEFFSIKFLAVSFVSVVAVGRFNGRLSAGERLLLSLRSCFFPAFQFAFSARSRR